LLKISSATGKAATMVGISLKTLWNVYTAQRPDCIRR